MPVGFYKVVQLHFKETETEIRLLDKNFQTENAV